MADNKVKLRGTVQLKICFQIFGQTNSVKNHYDGSLASFKRRFRRQGDFKDRKREYFLTHYTFELHT
jgi:hypothetical protein